HTPQLLPRPSDPLHTPPPNPPFFPLSLHDALPISRCSKLHTAKLSSLRPWRPLREILCCSGRLSSSGSYGVENHETAANINLLRELRMIRLKYTQQEKWYNVSVFDRLYGWQD